MVYYNHVMVYYNCARDYIAYYLTDSFHEWMDRYEVVQNGHTGGGRMWRG